MPVPGEAVEIAPGVIRLTAPNPGPMTGPGTNSYLLGRRPVTVLDPGPDDEVHVGRLLAAAPGPIGVVAVTHTHPDHAPAAAALARASGATVVGFGARDGFEPDATAAEGYGIDVDGRTTLRALHTPGHASNHLCWLLEEEGVLFSGDHVMDGSTVVIAPPDGDMAAYLDQLRRLRRLGLGAIAPGHGRLITDPDARLDGYLAHRAEREQQVVTALAAAPEPQTVADLVAAIYVGTPEALLPVARFSVWAHLRKLAAEGRASCADADDVAAPWAAAGAKGPGP